MATINAVSGVVTAFASGDTVIITLNPNIQEFQLTSQGFALDAATITAVPLGGIAAQAVVFPSPVGITAVIDDFRVASVTLTGITGAGPFAIAAYQG